MTSSVRKKHQVVVYDAHRTSVRIGQNRQHLKIFCLLFSRRFVSKMAAMILSATLAPFFVLDFCRPGIVDGQEKHENAALTPEGHEKWNPPLAAGVDQEVKNPVTFQNSASHVILSFHLSLLFNFRFTLKSRQSDGLLVYSGQVRGTMAQSRDFMALEMIDGRLAFSFDLGSGTRVLRAPTRGRLDDGGWHHVIVSRSSLDRYVLVVDGQYFQTVLPSNASNNRLDAGDEMFIGGIPGYAFGVVSREVASRQGFVGCLGSVWVNDRQVDLLENPFDVPSPHRNSVLPGCREKRETKGCAHVTCHNGGRCHEHLDGYFCNCDLTSFTGPTCAVDSVAYSFRGRSLITFELAENEWLDTRRDEITFGFKTNQSDAVLVSLSSATSDDHVDVEIVEAKVLVVYDVGYAAHFIEDVFTVVNDGQYHVIRFTRDGPNSTLQVDDSPLQRKHPAGNQSLTFNHLSKVSIGGRPATDGKIVRQFEGIIAGLVVNSFKMLDRAAEGDERIAFEGDIELHMKPLRDQTATVPGHTSGTPFSDCRIHGCHWSTPATAESTTRNDDTLQSTNDSTSNQLPDDVASSGTMPCHKGDEDDIEDNNGDDDGEGGGDDDDCRNSVRGSVSGARSAQSSSPMATSSASSFDVRATRKRNGQAEAPSQQGPIYVEKNVSGSLAMNMALIGGIGAGVLVLLAILVYAICKYRTKEIETRRQKRVGVVGRTCESHSTDFEFPPSGGGGIRCNPKGFGGGGVSSTNRRACGVQDGWQQGRKGKKRDVKEWYV